jgi:hypothetical protein
LHIARHPLYQLDNLAEFLDPWREHALEHGIGGSKIHVVHGLLGVKAVAILVQGSDSCDPANDVGLCATALTKNGQGGTIEQMYGELPH